MNEERATPSENWCPSLHVASFPGSPLARAIIALPFNSHSHGKTGGEPAAGTFYHVSDVEGRENLIARG